jgi:hypothetical protein
MRKSAYDRVRIRFPIRNNQRIIQNNKKKLDTARVFFTRYAVRIRERMWDGHTPEEVDSTSYDSTGVHHDYIQTTEAIFRVDSRKYSKKVIVHATVWEKTSLAPKLVFSSPSVGGRV